MILNSGQTGTPAASLRSGIEIERGDSTNVKLQFNENTDKWEFTNDGSTFYQFPITIGDLASAKLELDHDLIIDSKIVTKHSNTVKTMVVTVVTKTAAHPAHGTGSTLGYSIDGIESPELTFAVGNTYKFDQSDSSNGTHPLLFYYNEDKTGGTYSSGVTTNGTPGQSGAYTQIIPTESTPTSLYYQCSAHANMGWKSVFNTRNLTGFTTDNLTEGSSNLYFTNARADGRIAAASIDALSDVDITTSAPSSGQALVWDGSKFEPGAVGSTLTVKDESTTLSTAATTLKFAGTGVTASGTGAEKTITIPGGTSGITIQEEGSSLSTLGTTLNFTGDAVTASGSGAVKTINIAGSGGSGGTVTIEKNVYTGDGSDVTFNTTTAIANENNVQVYIDGVYQSKDNYTTSGSTVTMSTAPGNSASVELIHMVSTSGVIARDSFTGNGSTTAYVLSMSISNENATQVYLDGVYQSKNNYSTSGSTLTFSTAPPNGTAIEVVHIKAVNASSLNQNNFTGNGSTTAFTLSQTIDDEAKTFVFIQGVYQEKSTYSISGTTLTFSTAPQNGYTIEVMAFSTISVGNQGVTSLNGLTGAVTLGTGTEWQSAIKTSNFTATAGEGYFVDTTSSSVTATLPSSPSVGDLIYFVDYGGNSAVNPIVFTTSDNIEGGSVDQAIQYNKGAVQLVFSGATKGWISVSASGEGSEALPTPITSVDVHFLVLAGGGGSDGDGYYRGGGGAGGLRTSTGSTYSGRGSSLESALTLNLAQNYTFTVGAGGAEASGTYTTNQGNGGDTTFASVTSNGGGGASSGSTSGPGVAGIDGGCGGGAFSIGGTAQSGGSGTAGQGYDGGSASGYNNGGGGGGGGTQSNGAGNSNRVGGTGGAGTQNDINGTSTYYGSGAGGIRGWSTGSGNGTNGTGWSTTRTQTGHGGGWGAGVGGSGIIILKYPATFTATFSSGAVQNTGQISWNGALYNVSTITGGSSDTVSFAYTG